MVQVKQLNHARPKFKKSIKFIMCYQWFAMDNNNWSVSMAEVNDQSCIWVIKGSPNDHESQWTVGMIISDE